MQVQVSTSMYQFSHGKMPRGKGNWAFNIRGEVVFLPGMYSDVKITARKMANESGVSTIKLLP